MMTEPSLKTNMSSRALIDFANTVPLSKIFLDVFGIEAPETDEFTRSVKMWCPFQFDHPNPLDRNFRFYPATNTCYCFEVHGLLTPVKLIAMSRDKGYRDAALWLVVEYDLARPRPYKERWQQLMLEQEHKPQLDLQTVCAALHVFISSSKVAPYQFDPEIQKVVAHRLELLDQLTRISDAQNWLFQSKQLLVITVDSLHSN